MLIGAVEASVIVWRLTPMACNWKLVMIFTLIAST